MSNINRNFVRSVLAEGGVIKPLIIPSEASSGLGLCNPSVFIDEGEIWLILRNVNYTLYHCENEQTFNNRWGPLSYLNPEHDLHLRTTNFLCKLTPDLEIESYRKIDTSTFDKEPLWEFVGLEDARLVRWNGHLYGIGVRRDTTTNGQGRMEFSELEVTDESVKEIGRYRIEPPLDPLSYCEKNWLPVLDKPYHFIKWTNPAELVEADLKTLTSHRAREVNEADKKEGLPFLRGSSQVIRWREFYVCIVHDCDLVKNRNGQKDATYMHRFVVYDTDWNIVNIGEPFSFMDGEIEFCCGLAEWQGDFLVSLGFQDNAAFLLRIPALMLPKLLRVGQSEQAKWRSTAYPTLEITTAIPKNGCPLACTCCPQDSLTAKYTGERVLSFKGFKELISKVPREVQITFAGYCEPFVNPDCMDMIRYAHSTGHKVSVFTTAVGLDDKDIAELRTIPFSGVQGGFVLHLPDEDGHFTHSVNEKMMKTYRELAKGIANFQPVTMGALSEKLREIFPNVTVQTLHDRAGNVDRQDVIHIAGTEQPTTCGCQERLYHSVLLPNGDVSLCCMDYGLKHIHGNLFRQSFEEIMPVDGTPFKLCETCENGVRA